MKLIKAIIKPEKLRDVKAQLEKENVFGMTVYDVHGAGQQMGYREEYRGVTQEVNLLRKVVIELVVEDKMVDRMIKAIIKGAQTGNIGDGKIFVFDVKDAIRIRTGDKGDKAINGMLKD